MAGEIITQLRARNRATVIGFSAGLLTDCSQSAGGRLIQLLLSSLRARRAVPRLMIANRDDDWRCWRLPWLAPRRQRLVRLSPHLHEPFATRQTFIQKLAPSFAAKIEQVFHFSRRFENSRSLVIYLARAENCRPELIFARARLQEGYFRQFEVGL